MKSNRAVQLVLLFLIVMISGCLDSSLNLTLRYDEVAGLKKGDPIYFQENEVGKVDNITYTANGDYLVEISIDKEFKNSATEDSLFFIEEHRAVQDSKSVTIYQQRSGGSILEEGAVVAGSVRPGLIEELVRQFEQNANLAEVEIALFLQQLKESMEAASRQLDRELETALEDLSRQLQEYQQEIKKVPDSEEMKQLEKSIDQLAEEFMNAQQDVQDYIQNVMLPYLQKEFDLLKEKLEKEGREEEIEGIERQMKEMTMV